MFYNNFEKLCTKIEKNPSTVAEELGFTKSMASHWKRGMVPRVSSRKKIADYFGISVEELMGTKKEPAGQGELEREWADIEVAYKSATPEARAAAKAAALAVLESSKKEG